MPIKGRSVTVEEIDLSGVQKTAGDLQVGQLDEVMADGVEGIVANMDDYRRLRPQLFPCHDAAIAGMAAWAERQRRGEALVWSPLYPSGKGKVWLVF
mgnify:CR=1 FL=1